MKIRDLSEKGVLFVPQIRGKGGCFLTLEHEYVPFLGPRGGAGWIIDGVQSAITNVTMEASDNYLHALSVKFNNGDSKAFCNVNGNPLTETVYKAYGTQLLFFSGTTYTDSATGKYLSSIAFHFKRVRQV